MRLFEASISDLISFAAVALRQRAYFACHDGETAPLLASASGFHCRVERQDIGLESDAFYGADNFFSKNSPLITFIGGSL